MDDEVTADRVVHNGARWSKKLSDRLPRLPAMRTDLTVRTAPGVDHDLAVLAPEGTTWGAVSAAAAEAAGGARPLWCGRRRLEPHLVVGRAPLVPGAVLTFDAASAPEATGARLEVVGGHDCGASVPLRDGLVIGRDPDCDLVLTDPRVSRRHAMVSVAGDRVAVTDLDSTSGLFLGTRRVQSAALGAHYPVQVGGDLLAVADTTPVPAAARPNEIEFPAAPAPDPAPRRTFGVLVPMVAAAGLAWLTGSWEFLAFAVLGPIGTLGTAGGRSRPQRGRVSRRRRRRAAGQRAVELARAQAAVATGLHAELVDRLERQPHPAALLRAVDAAGVPDGLVVRLGLGSVTSMLTLRCGSERAAAGRLQHAPVTVDLGVGVVGLAAPPALCAGLARWLVAQFAARAPSGARCVVVDPVGVTETSTWHWLRWLGPSARVAVELRTDLPADRADGCRAGATTVLVLARDPAELPAGCAATIRAVAEPAGAVLVQTAATSVVALADRVSPSWCESFARALARRDAADGGAGGGPGGGPGRVPVVPTTCRASDLLTTGTPAQVRARWVDDDGSAVTTIGRAAAGPVELDLDADGPHVLVAGSTGAGKSELLQGLVAGLALGHPPGRMSFLLIDYKGGAAFADCADLPHTVGLVTDLDAQLTRRVLRSLTGEVRRRERLLAEAAAADLRAYRRRSPASAPARLVIVVDEFATLAEELPTFVTGLVGIARRGRSLGLHLVLATQRPAGVVSAEIRANCALRICLRVTSATESADVVDTPDAAAIPAHLPGRGYLRRSGLTTEFQTVRVSGPAPAVVESVRVLPVAAADQLSGAPADADTELRAVVALARAAAQDAPRPHRPWLPQLPARVPLGTLVPRRLDRLAVGVIDRPDEQEQPALTLDLIAGGVIAVAGRGGSGRTTVLRTIALAAAAAATADGVHIHAIDAAGTGLAALLALRQVGTVAQLADGFDLTAALVAHLLGAVRPAAAAPRLVLIDGWEQLCTASDDFDGGRTTERLLALARAARATATTLVLTGARAVLSAQVAAVAATRFVLALTDPADYLIAGVAAGALADDAPPGRAIRVGDGAEVQFAVGPVPNCAPGPVRPARLAERLRSLPGAVRLADLGPGPGVCLGVGGDHAEPIRVDLLGSGAWVLVAGPPRSGRTTLLHSVLVQSRPDECIVAAPPRSPLHTFARSIGVAVLSDGGGQLPARGLAVIDDAEQLADTAAADQLEHWLTEGAPGRAVVAAGRTEALSLGYRGLISRLRSAGVGVALHPAPGDPPVFGVPVPGGRSARPPGRGVLVPDPRWGLGVAPVPLQIAVPGSVATPAGAPMTVPPPTAASC